MSKYSLVSALQKELKKINQQIDMKIVAGQSYTREARRHKNLLYQLSHMRTRSSFGFFSLFS